MLAVNLFHMRGGKIVDRREMFWEDLRSAEETIGEESGGPPEDKGTEGGCERGSYRVQRGGVLQFPAEQIYLGNAYVPRTVLVPVDFADRAVLGELLTERTGHQD